MVCLGRERDEFQNQTFLTWDFTRRKNSEMEVLWFTNIVLLCIYYMMNTFLRTGDNSDIEDERFLLVIEVK